MQDTAAKLLGALPRLRRYAYVLMGSRERADTYIRLSLEIAVEDIERLALTMRACATPSGRLRRGAEPCFC
jgi:hypothetical protein